MVKTRSGPPPSPPPSLNARIMESSSVKDSECFLQNQKVVVAEEAGVVILKCIWKNKQMIMKEKEGRKERRKKEERASNKKSNKQTLLNFTLAGFYEVNSHSERSYAKELRIPLAGNPQAQGTNPATVTLAWYPFPEEPQMSHTQDSVTQCTLGPRLQLRTSIPIKIIIKLEILC
ncbi:transmembrane protein 253 isoform X3 [Tursiops truncatus]|uniref:transmembrane protein 253 isoform X3 n=1 Tax=Tursiops truncatus TaxID=9739 RepID=UPI003CCF228A